MKRIGILTGGGDVPGLNACIKEVVSLVTSQGGEMVGIRRGWAGLLNYNIDDPESASKYALPLDRQNTRTVDRFGGTFLHTSRTNPGKVAAKNVPDFLREAGKDYSGDEAVDCTAHVLKVLAHLKLDALITIGGDDTLSYSHRVHSEGFPVIAIPKTMDNDVYGTDYCIGFSTAVSRSIEFINSLRTSTGSHERICIVELFGRNSGETSLISAYLSGVDRAIISEVPFNPDVLADMLAADKKANPSNYAIMTISEGAVMQGGEIIETGAADAYGHRKLGGVGQILGDAVKKRTGQNIVYQQVAYLMRSGEPDALDKMVAKSFATLATELVLKGQSGLMTALSEGRYTYVPVDTIMQGLKRVDVAELYDTENYRPRVKNMLNKPMFLY
ncbi:6-phosphofructokinase [soil metagenome]